MEWKENECLGINIRAMHHRARRSRRMYLRVVYARVTHPRTRHDVGYGKTRNIKDFNDKESKDKACNGNTYNCMECKGNACLDRNIRARHHMARHLRTMNI
jgi:hypothetical protein